MLFVPIVGHPQRLLQTVQPPARSATFPSSHFALAPGRHPATVSPVPRLPHSPTAEADSRPPRRLGLIGLGLLGSALASRAIASGWTVSGYDLESARRDELASTGGHACHSAAEAASAGRFLLLVLPDDTIAGRVLSELADAAKLPPGSVVLDATTGAPEAAERLALELAARGATYLDTTVSGSSEQVRRGEALLMVGGPAEAVAQAHGLLAALAPRVFHTGAVGSAARMKLVTNLVLGLNRAALAEGIAFARALGVDPTEALEILSAGPAASRVMQSKGPKMLTADFSPQARLSQHLKDVRLMLDAASRTGQRLPFTETHREVLETAERLGLGALDNSAILRAIEASTHPTRRIP